MKKSMGLRMLCMPALFILFAAGITLTACGDKKSARDDQNAAQTSKSEVFGMFTAETLDGAEVTQDIFKEADLTMVNIWGTFCGPCIREMPELGEISREYEGQGVQIVGMLCDVYEAGDETALKIVEETKADYIHIVASPDLQNGILRQVQAVPTTVFVDSDGNQVGKAYTGSQDKESWIKIIEEVKAAM